MIALREAIASGELKPGERLYQDAIAERMGVSRVPVREALHVLRADGQLDYSPHKGYWVSALTLESVEEINLIRRLLESEAIRLAVPKLDREVLEKMEALDRDMKAAHEIDDIPRFASLNHDFHFALFDRAGLPRLSQHIEMLWKSVDIYRMSVFTDHATRESMMFEHNDLLEACRQGDVIRVLEVTEVHRGKALDTLSIVVTAADDDGATPHSMRAGAATDAGPD